VVAVEAAVVAPAAGVAVGVAGAGAAVDQNMNT